MDHAAAVLTMRGPDFLLLFLATSAVVYIVVSAAIAAGERKGSTMARVRDPYAIAYLRGNTPELVRVVVLSLTLRGLLRLTAGVFQTTDPTEIQRVTAQVEKAILTVCRNASAPRVIVRNPSVEAAAEAYRRELTERGLLPDARAISVRWAVVLLGIAVLGIFALAKIMVAMATGHRNVLFLIILAACASGVLLLRIRQRRTYAGSCVLRDLKVLFASLPRRASVLTAAAIPEATLLAAVFGTYVTPGLDLAAWRKAFPPATSSDSSSSCGSSGCGSGGCGGGGGGCGGCGS